MSKEGHGKKPITKAAYRPARAERKSGAWSEAVQRRNRAVGIEAAANEKRIGGQRKELERG